jgi:formylglycine-generating enzyme required for sulfatase activity
MKLQIFSFYLLVTFIFIKCDSQSPSLGEDKIQNPAINGTWISNPGTSNDTAKFNETKLQIPGLTESATDDFMIKNGQITVNNTVIAEYEIQNDTLFIEKIQPPNTPDGIIDHANALKFTRKGSSNIDTGTVNRSGMDSIGRYIPVGLAINYNDSNFTAGMALIKAKNDTFTMGMKEFSNEPLKYAYPHKVCLTYDYYIDKKETTCEVYCKAMNYALKEGYIEYGDFTMYSIKSKMIVNKLGQRQGLLDMEDQSRLIRFTGDKFEPYFDPKYPVNFITWYGAAFYCNMLSEMKSLEPVYDTVDWSINYKSNGYRLATSAEFECACRAGSDKNYFWGDNYSLFERYAYWGESVMAVGSKNANKFGLYDIVGNVGEWCNDWFAMDYFSVSPFYDPVGPAEEFLKVSNTSGTNKVVKNRVYRGSSGDEITTQAGYYNWLYPYTVASYVGFRLVIPVKTTN